jgi:DNA-binding MarR family transcriptional regulator
MNHIELLEKYIATALCIEVHATLLPGIKQFPFFLQDAYQFYQMTLMGRLCTILIEDDAENSPAAISKHIDIVQQQLGMPCIYVCDAITAYNRERLINHRVSFIVPGNQMFLPFLGIDLRDYFLKKRIEKAEKLSPAALTTLIYMMARVGDEFRPAELAQGTGYTTMSISRAVDKIESMGLIVSERSGRDRLLRMDKKDLWRKITPLAQSPVKQRVFLREDAIDLSKYLRAGYDALAHFSSINKPNHPIIAMSTEEWRALKQQGIKTVEFGEIEVEVWQINPRLFADEQFVNRYFLYLSLKDNKDERIEMTLEEMMDGLTHD